jgi:hypothetical protein
VRCLLPQEGQSKRMVMWQRWQKRATSRTAAPHFGQGIVAWGAGVAVGSHLSAVFGGRCEPPSARAAVCDPLPGTGGFTAADLASDSTRVGWSAGRGSASDAASGGFPPFCPEDASPAITHLNCRACTIREPRRALRPQGNPVRRDRDRT